MHSSLLHEREKLGDHATPFGNSLPKRDFFGDSDRKQMPRDCRFGHWARLPTNRAGSEFDQWLWPHVSRKAALIETMLQTSSNLYQKVEGPIVPANKGNPNLSLVAEPARDGLIVGKMDHQRPVLFVNAIFTAAWWR